jgi:hypothetical protein
VKLLVVGMLHDALGFTRRTRTVAANPWLTGRTFVVRSYHSAEVVDLRPSQRSPIAVNLRHDRRREVGEVVHLEVDPGGSVWALCEVDAEKIPDGPNFYSSETLGPDHDARLTGVAITPDPAMVCMPPLRALPFDRHGLTEVEVLRLRRSDPHLAGVLDRARGELARRRHGDPLRVVRPAPKTEPLSGGGVWLVGGEGLIAAEERTGQMVYDDEGRQLGPMRYSTPYHGVIAVR